ncbi:MAG: hypothetical protein IKY16_06600 [Bacteroidales bacterium]|nr:hypothetical protein [Clostridia bacterium]MBR5014259.1 hypothetical protein [Bacteroidales bacterium]
MSVVKSERTQSTMEFLDNAHKLYIYTVQQCVNFPKRYTFYVSTEIAAVAGDILVSLKSGNSIYPRNAHEAQVRRDWFMKAYTQVQSLISLINAAHEMFGISGKTMQRWMEMISIEANLIKGVLEADKKRFKNLT